MVKGNAFERNQTDTVVLDVSESYAELGTIYGIIVCLFLWVVLPIRPSFLFAIRVCYNNPATLLTSTGGGCRDAETPYNA